MAIPATSLLSAYLKRLCSSRGHSVSRAVVLNDRSGRVKGMCGRNSGDFDEGGKLAPNGERDRATVLVCHLLPVGIQSQLTAQAARQL